MPRSDYGGFGEGIIIRGVPLLTLCPGTVYWVDSTSGKSSTKGTYRAPVKSIAAAFALVTTEKGDIIACKPGHAEAPTATVDLTGKSNFSIIGTGYGTNRPTISPAMASATDDVWDIDGDDVVVYNMRFVDDTAGTTVTVINCSGSNFHIEGCEIELGAKSLVGISHDTTGKAGFTAINNLFFSTQDGPNNAIVFEKDHDNFVIQGNRFQFTGGCDDGVILYTSGDVGAGGWVDNNVCIGLANAEVFVLQTKLFLGLVSNNLIVGADATDNLGASPASGAGFIDNFVTEPGLGVPGIADHAGARPINTTPGS